MNRERFRTLLCKDQRRQKPARGLLSRPQETPSAEAHPTQDSQRGCCHCRELTAYLACGVVLLEVALAVSDRADLFDDNAKVLDKARQA